MIEYKWTIERVQVIESIKDKENVVKKISFLFEGQRGEKNEFVIDEVELSFNSESELFTPFEELTEEEIISWVVSAVGEEKITYYKELISERFGPENVVDKPLPWKKLEEETIDQEVIDE